MTNLILDLQNRLSTPSLFAEDLFEMTPIAGTRLFYGVGYRLRFRNLENVPVTYKNVDADTDIMVTDCPSRTADSQNGLNSSKRQLQQIEC